MTVHIQIKSRDETDDFAAGEVLEDFIVHPEGSESVADLASLCKYLIAKERDTDE
jgi:hypothetical protein